MLWAGQGSVVVSDGVPVSVTAATAASYRSVGGRRWALKAAVVAARAELLGPLFDVLFSRLSVGPWLAGGRHRSGAVLGLDEVRLGFQERGNGLVGSRDRAVRA